MSRKVNKTASHNRHHDGWFIFELYDTPAAPPPNQTGSLQMHFVGSRPTSVCSFVVLHFIFLLHFPVMRVTVLRQPDLWTMPADNTNNKDDSTTAATTNYRRCSATYPKITRSAAMLQFLVVSASTRTDFIHVFFSKIHSWSQICVSLVVFITYPLIRSLRTLFSCFVVCRLSMNSLTSVRPLILFVGDHDSADDRHFFTFATLVFSQFLTFIIEVLHVSQHKSIE